MEVLASIYQIIISADFYELITIFLMYSWMTMTNDYLGLALFSHDT